MVAHPDTAVMATNTAANLIVRIVVSSSADATFRVVFSSAVTVSSTPRSLPLFDSRNPGFTTLVWRASHGGELRLVCSFYGDANINPLTRAPEREFCGGG